jgi:hypothetical protein
VETDIYDVHDYEQNLEQEVNGLYTYDHRAKFDPALIHRINSKKAAIED